MRRIYSFPNTVLQNSDVQLQLATTKLIIVHKKLIILNGKNLVRYGVHVILSEIRHAVSTSYYVIPDE